jgi:hypothetical protein
MHVPYGKGYNGLKWPPYSLYLNSVEHIWLPLKEKLNQRYLDIADSFIGSDAVGKYLADMFPEIWEININGEFLEKL